MQKEKFHFIPYPVANVFCKVPLIRDKLGRMPVVRFPPAETPNDIALREAV